MNRTTLIANLRQSTTPRPLEFYRRCWNFQKSFLTKSTEVLHFRRYCYGIGIHRFRVRSSTQSALLEHFVDYYCYSHPSSHCEDRHLDLDFPLPALALGHCFQGGIAGHAYAATGEDVPAVGPGDATGSSEVLDSVHIDQKAV